MKKRVAYLIRVAYLMRVVPVAAIFLAAVFMAASGAEAGPSRAIIQELGTVAGKDEVNIDVDVVSQGFNVVTPGDTTLGNGNATVGGITVSSVNVGIADGLELRIGRLPGFRSFLTLPAVGAVALNPAGNNYGLTLKGAVPNVPGLAAWLGYGTVSQRNISNASGDAADADGSSLRLGAAYTTTSGPWVFNGTLGYGTDSAKSGGLKVGDVSTIEAAAAALYPLRPSILAGVELHYAKMSVGDDAAAAGDQKFDITALAPAVAVRAMVGNWTIDAVIALLGTNIKVDGTPALPASLQETATSTVVGLPALRVNYKF
ncbi:MAG: hypothetical protein HZB21_05875 [Deltaproteobacteria bacterium]|nr:hypothetical protein [Deltaproteobacteria bacterium]